MPIRIDLTAPLITLIIIGTALSSPPSAEAQAPSLQFTSPVAGQIFKAGETCAIAWTSTGLTGQIYFDLYRGSDQVRALGSPPAQTGVWEFAVPRLFGSEEYRILAAGTGANGEQVAQWTESFAIEPSSVELLTLNGGEVLDAGATYTIQWLGLDETCDAYINLTLEKGGRYYTRIDWPRPSGRSCDWNICNLIEPGSDYAVRIDYYAWGMLYTDRSDLPFTIRSEYSPSLTLLSPNGGENLTAGEPVTVRWSAIDLGEEQVCVSLVDPAGRSDSLGCAQASVGELTASLCSSLQSSQGYGIQISSTRCGRGLTDRSDAPIQVTNYQPPAPIQVTLPSGGEVFESGAQFLVTWTGSTFLEEDLYSGRVQVSLNLRQPGQFDEMLPHIVIGPRSLLTYFCSAHGGSDFTLRLTLRDCAGERVDETPPFSIMPSLQPTLTLLSPTSGQALRAGEPLTIRWTGRDLPSSVRAELRRDDPYVRQDLGSATGAAGQLTATVCPGLEDGDDYRIVVSSYAECSTAKSEAPVTVVGGLPQSVVTITSPAQGDVWITGTQQRITWAGSNLRGSVQLELWRGDEQVDWLGGGPADARERVWDVCAWEPGDDYSFLLTAYECGRTTEFRGARFTILPSEQPPPTITVTSPNGGEVIGGGSHQVITWTSTNPRGNVWIDLMQGDNYWTSVGQAAMADGRFEWDVCRFGAPGSHRIRVSHSECPYAVADESDSPITLTDVLPWPTVGGVAPSWSDVIQAGSTARIAWDVENPAGDVTISLLRGYWPYLDLGEAPMAAGGFDWQVCPWLEPGSNYRIALYMSACGEIHVVDEGLSFTIAGPGLPSADLDLDCDVDADDIDRFEPCATGPGIPYNLEFLPPGCLPNSVTDAYLPADLDRDGDVDQDDFGILQRSLTEQTGE